MSVMIQWQAHHPHQEYTNDDVPLSLLELYENEEGGSNNDSCKAYSDSVVIIAVMFMSINVAIYVVGVHA
jgi:hypothetical protein